MKLTGAAVHYLLSQQFDDVVSAHLSRSALFDYPLLYDESTDIGGHVVLMQKEKTPKSDEQSQTSLFVCVSEVSAQAARTAELPTVHVRDDITFSQLYNYMQALFVRNERLDARLRAYLDTYAGFQPLLDACAQDMGFACALIDRQYRSVYQAIPGESTESETARYALSNDSAPNTTDPADSNSLLETDAIDLFMAASSYRSKRTSHNVFALPGSTSLFMKNLFAHDALIGTLVVKHDGTETGARFAHFLLNYLSPFVEEMYARIGSFDAQRASSSRVRAVLNDLVAGNPTAAASLEKALIEDGHAPRSSYVVLRIERSFTNEGAEEHDYLSRRFELSWPRGYCFTADDNLFMIADVGDGSANTQLGFLRDLPVIARENLAKVGISRRFSSMHQLDAARTQASIALSQGNVTDPTGWCYRFGDYALSWLITRAKGNLPAEYISHPAPQILIAYDREHDTDLAKTLNTFLRCQFNATAAAKELFVARSTLLNRLERIKELTQVDLDDARECLYLGLSFELLE